MLTNLKMREVKTQPLCSIGFQVCDQIRAEAETQVTVRVWNQSTDQVETTVILQIEDEVKWLLLDQIEEPR